MTVVYTHEVATGGKGFGNFGRLLFRWTGSIYKLVLPDLSVYVILYYIINICYRLLLADKPKEDPYKQKFHSLVEYCQQVADVLPLQFILGFYVSQICTRWWAEFMTTPWPDTLGVSVAACVRGHDERGRMMRRTMLRYVNTCLTMVFTMISPQARSRFPTLDDLVQGGFLVPHEKIIIEHLNEKSEGPKYFVPIVWAGAVAVKARKEGRIRDDASLYQLIKELCKFRTMAGDMLSYDWVCIPLVYTQVATLCTYVYFASCLFGKQLIKHDDTIDIYVPVFHLAEFFFLMGWLKVAETMINPFGEDDDDFEVNWLIDRNLTVSYMMVDEMNSEFPEMLKDAYWDGVVPDELPYTAEALKFKTEGMGQGSAAIKEKEQDVERDDTSRRGGNPSEGSRSTTHSVRNKFSFLPLLSHEKHGHKKHHQQPSTTGENPRFNLKRDDKGSSSSVNQWMDKSFVPDYQDSSEDLLAEKKSNYSQ